MIELKLLTSKVSRPGDVIKLTTHSLHFSPLIMSREMMLGMLRQGNTGSQILQILDVIAEDYSSSSDKKGDAVSYTTGEAIVF